MNREIKFRGKRVDNGEWVYGWLSQWSNEDYQIKQGFEDVCSTRTVIPETVGQFTGLHDKNGKGIYEGDIVNLAHEDTHPLMRKKNLVVRFDEKDACFIVGDSLALTNVLEIIGNIHDNTELLEERKMKKVFSVRKYIEWLLTRSDVELIASIKIGWCFDCVNLTEEEMNSLGYTTKNEWMIEVDEENDKKSI